MSRRPRDARRRDPQRSLLQRYGFGIASVLVVVGVFVLGAAIYLQASRPAFACESLLIAPAASPSPAPSATPGPTPVPTATPTPSSTATPQATPTASPTPEASATPAESPTASPEASPTPAESPTAEPTPSPEPTPWIGFGVPDRGRNHVPASVTIHYAECPPTSGPHYDSPAKRGYYGPDQNLPVGAWVHSLEHGMVVLLYRCEANGNACPDQATLDQLRAFADSAPQTDVAAACPPAGIANKLIVARFDQMSTHFAVVGWDRALLSDTFDEDAFLTFYNQWVDNSPTDEARGCDGPTGAE